MSYIMMLFTTLSWQLQPKIKGKIMVYRLWQCKALFRVLHMHNMTINKKQFLMSFTTCIILPQRV